jgi:hypothetical protein
VSTSAAWTGWVNRELANGPHLEILNLGVHGYSALQTLAVFEDRALAFRPSAAVFVAHPTDFAFAVDFLARLATRELDPRYPWLRDILARTGITQSTPFEEARKLLLPWREELIQQFNRHWLALCREKGIQPVWLILPSDVGVDRGAEDADDVLRLARESGVLVVNLLDVYDGHDPETLYVGDWDRHPNDLGHQLIADRLYQLLRENPDALLPGFAVGAPAVERARVTPAAP